MYKKNSIIRCKLGYLVAVNRVISLFHLYFDLISSKCHSEPRDYCSLQFTDAIVGHTPVIEKRLCKSKNEHRGKD